MKLVLVGDVHLRATPPSKRKDDFLASQLSKINQIFEIARSEQAPIVCTGDLFDTDAPSLSLIVRYLPVFLKHEYGFYVVPGNHDLYGASLASLNRSAFGVFAAAGAITTLSHAPTPVQGSDVFAYGTSYMHEGALQPRQGFSILVVHDMILEDKIWKEQEHFTFAKDYLESHDRFDLILCGHYHYRFARTSGDCSILNPGAVVRVKASKGDMALTPGVYVYDTETRKYDLRLLRCQPADEVFLVEEKLQKAKENEALREFVDALVDESSTDGITSDSLSEVVIKVLQEAKASDNVRKIVQETIAQAELGG